MGMRKPAVSRIPISVFALLLLLLAVPAAAERPGDVPRAASVRAEQAAYADRLLEAARRRRLHEAPYWHILLHYSRGLAGLRSLVDDPRFFLSPRGAHDPAAELEATLRAFFQPEAAGVKHPVCRFVARYHWLKETLGLDPSRLPAGECEAFARLIAQMKPEAATLVFPASHMNNPASMFGHTLLVYEPASRNRLLAHAVNYAAVTPETFGPLFAVKGVAGLYKGYFSVLPYYAKLQEYADIDHRDMWEYPLNFTREETIRSIRHVYELDGIYSDYYFFDENCSYSLLFLLDAGRPSLRLTQRASPWVIPLETVRAVRDAGLITGAVYRPSKTTTIRHLASLLDRPSRLQAKALAQGRAEPASVASADLPPEQKARTLELAVEYLQYLYYRRELDRTEYTARFLALLAARSALGVPQGERPAPRPPERPDAGHRSARLRLGAGLDKAKLFQEVRFRFAYHTLADHDAGYPEGSHIVFGDTAVRYLVEERRARLEQLDLVDILSIAPRDELFKPLSWRITAGATQRVMEDGQKHLVFRLSPGVGVAYRIPVLGLWYGMLEADANAGEALEEHHALGLGASTGLVTRVTDRWSLLLSARATYYGLGDRHGLLDVRLTQNYALTPDVAVSLEVSRSRTRDFYRTEGILGLNVFF